MKFLPASRMLFWITFLSFSACQSPPPAEFIELPVLFSDHMVFQRNAMTPVWGKATPGQRVTVVLNNQRAQTTALDDSTWQVYLSPEPAGGPHTLSVIGIDTLVINDVLTGEVWLASGQSNMQWSVEQSANADAEIEEASYPNIRLFSVERTASPKPLTKIPSEGWKLTTPETVRSFSAVAYYFGRTLHDSLEVPVGLIHSSWGGTPVEAWTSAAALRELSVFDTVLDNLEAEAELPQEDTQSYAERMDAWLVDIENNDPGYESGRPVWATHEFDHSSWPTMQVPGEWEQTLPNYDGIVWFRKSIELPANWAEKEGTLHLANVDDVDITWVNGVEVGRTRQYSQKRTYTIPASLLRAGVNTIAVRVLDTGGGGGIRGEPNEIRLENADAPYLTIPLAGEWHYETAVDLENVSQGPPRPRQPQHTPTMLFNAMIHPLVPYRIQGVIWYQGESNAARAHQYRSLFTALINDWRLQWDTNLAFHFVQLANFRDKQVNPVEQETWPELREAQTMALSLPNTGMAVTIDIGEADDIHPRNKQDVGYRLALNALYTNYDRPVVPAGPLYESIDIRGDTVQVFFRNADQGLTTSDGLPPKGFALAGTDRTFYWADATIQGNTVLLHSDRVPDPVAVRYGWANNPIVTLYNTDGLPASPFRTDQWPGITENNP